MSEVSWLLSHVLFIFNSVSIFHLLVEIDYDYGLLKAESNSPYH